MKQYDLDCKDDDPLIMLKLPSLILKDLILSSNENGNSIELEIIKRLARTLERDLKMIEDDNVLAIQAVTYMKSHNREI